MLIFVTSGEFLRDYNNLQYYAIGILTDTYNCGLRMRRECQERFPRYRGLAISTCIMALAWRTCRDACRDRLLAVTFGVGGGENVPGIPGACATGNFTYLVRGPWCGRSIAATHGIKPFQTRLFRVLEVSIYHGQCIVESMSRPPKKSD